MLQNMNTRDWKHTQINSAAGLYRAKMAAAAASVIIILCFTVLALAYHLVLGVPIIAGYVASIVLCCIAYCSVYIFAIFGELFWHNGLEIQTVGTTILTIALVVIHILYASLR